MLAAFWLVWVAGELFNPHYPSLLLSLAGAREYLSPAVAVVFGWFVVHYWGPREWKLVYRVVLFAVIGLVLFSLVQYIRPRRLLAAWSSHFDAGRTRCAHLGRRGLDQVGVFRIREQQTLWPVLADGLSAIVDLPPEDQQKSELLGW